MHSEDRRQISVEGPRSVLAWRLFKSNFFLFYFIKVLLTISIKFQFQVFWTKKMVKFGKNFSAMYVKRDWAKWATNCIVKRILCFAIGIICVFLVLEEFAQLAIKKFCRTNMWCEQKQTFITCRALHVKNATNRKQNSSFLIKVSLNEKFISFLFYFRQFFYGTHLFMWIFF